MGRRSPTPKSMDVDAGADAADDEAQGGGAGGLAENEVRNGTVSLLRQIHQPEILRP